MIERIKILRNLFINHSTTNHSTHSFKKAIGQTSPPITFYKKYIISNRFFNFNYFNSTVAPASSNSFFSFSASSLDTPSFTGLGAESTKSLASFNPKPV